ncbi:MAG: NUDIX domain-containing protein [Bacteroidota bacterium]
MYKVFFNDRTVYFGEDFSQVKEKEKELFYRFENSRKLKETVEHFSSSKQIRNLYLIHDDLPLLMEEFRACFTVIEAGGGVVFNRKGDFLTIKRNGVWDLPKGKLEEGEDFEAAALREVEEETGLKKLISLSPIISTYHTYQMADQKVLKKTQWFEMRYPGKKEPVLEAKEGITDHRWVKPGKTRFLRKNSYGSILDVLNIRELL